MTQPALQIRGEAAWQVVPVPSTDNASRADVYALLAALLREAPNETTLSVVRDISPAAADANDALGRAWQMLRLAAEHASPDTLEFEYNALFIGIGRGELVPYASWYLTGMINDRPLVALRHDLARLGFERQADVAEPEDHAAALLEVLRLMCAEPDVFPIPAQREFFATHLGPWMARFFADLHRAESAGFYAAVGTLGEAFMAFEERYLNMPG